MTRTDIILELDKLTKYALNDDVVHDIADFIEDNFYQGEDNE